MIAVEIGIAENREPNEVVEIYLDKEGLSELQGGSDHRYAAVFESNYLPRSFYCRHR